MAKVSTFDQEYKKLNKAQKEAVNSIEGPVMVVAGPGTGKTQILALRIGNILLRTDTKADGILCLTFTNSGVRAMKERLRKYIGSTGNKVNVFTFHSFGMKIIEEYYAVLDLETVPKLMDETDALTLSDQVLHDNDWEYIRPRSDASRYFGDLKSLISLLKRERLSPEEFLIEIEKDISGLKENPENISSRGESKGQIRKEILKNIEGLNRTREVAKFFKLYEETKKEKNVFDYDDVLENLVKIVENSDQARDEIREKYLYILIDEHQDSSGVQNEFLARVWGEVEKPNIFVVGDDRQLIYSFGGASLAYFEGFKHSFGKASLITLIDNYRSTQVILDSAHALLQSSITKEKLVSNHQESHPLRLVEADYPRDEIIACALDIKEKIKKGVAANDCAILVPKNKQVRSTITILKDMNMPVAGGEMMDLFDSSEAVSFLRVLKIVANPNDSVALADSFFDKYSLISPLKAHESIKSNNMREFSLLNIKEEKNNLSDGNNEINIWIGKLKMWLASSNEPLYSFIQKVGTEFLLDTAKNHGELVVRIEVLRTLLHLVLLQIEKPARPDGRSGGNPKLSLNDFLNFLERVENYGENIPLAIFSADDGVKVLTLHSSKGLEFDYVWIAHMDEKSFSGGKIGSFSLPESIKEKVDKRDAEVLKRQLYVALTRAKRFCTVSYALHSYTGRDQESAHIVADLEDNFEKQNATQTEKIILSRDQRAYVETKSKKEKHANLNDLVKLVTRDYESRKVSVSLLNNFFECPWKWYFRNLLQLPEPKSESLEFGNIVHGSIDAVLKFIKKPNRRDLKNIILHQVRKSGFGDERKQKELAVLAFNIVFQWVKNRLPEIELNRENEKSVSVKDDRFPHLNIYGKIDLIEHLDAKNVRVTDFKTGSVRKKGDIEKLNEDPAFAKSFGEARDRMSAYLRQLAMYSYLIKESSKNKLDARESRLEFLEAKDKKEIFYDRVITPEEIELLIKDISDYDNLVKKGEWTVRPCHYNSYGKDTPCEYCKMAEIYK
ncbi:MAG: DNA helicase II / ATP-dependent DNA helicase PcrA [Parcubacteria group bacterium Gr01-1014_24]|nr:MAG: DNA helicase II / ATP-dependent DNA helicase PcrA [Parcubacteria group bacterium Gr01-1014_24]